MDLAHATRRLSNSVLAIGLAAGLGLVGVVAMLTAFTSSLKLMAAAVAGSVVVVGALVSGNLRLFSLYGLMFTIPFDLSKRIGPFIQKMGGENSFRIEMSDPFLLLLLAFLLRDVLLGYRNGIRIPKLLLFWVGLMLLGCFAVVVGPWRTTAAHEVVRMFKVMLLFLVVCNELQRPARFLHCAAALTVGVIAQSAVGIVEFMTHGHFGLELLGETSSGTLDQLAAQSVWTERVYRAGAFLNHPNLFGIFLASLLPMAVAGFLARTGRNWKPLFLAGIVLGMPALIATLSRSGWVSFAVAFMLLTVLMTLHQSMRRRSILTMVLTGVLLLGVCVAFAGPITQRIFESKQSAMLSRMEYMKTAFGVIKARPLLGWGLNSYAYAAPPFTKYGAKEARERYAKEQGYWLPPVHNIFLLWWAETGAIGLGLFLVLIGAILRVGIRNLHVRNELLFAVNAACLAGLSAFVIDGFFSFSLRVNAILRVFWVLAGVIVAVHYWRLTHETDEPVPGRDRRWAAGGAIDAAPGS